MSQREENGFQEGGLTEGGIGGGGGGLVIYFFKWMCWGAYHLHGKNPEIPVGKSNGPHHSIWRTSEITSVLKVMHFITPFGIYS